MRLRQHAGTGGSDRPPTPGRVFTIQLSLISLLGICFVALIATGWVFAFGVIVGRGFEPEKKMPVLGRLMPQPQAPDAVPEHPDILKPEELTFFSDLKSQPTLSTEQPVPPARPSENRSGETRGKTPPTAGAPALSQPSAQRQAQAAASPQGKPADVKPAAEAKAPRYAFVYQAVTYKRAEQADTFREKLENAGLRTRLQVEKDPQGKARLYRILVLLTGTDADAEQARETLNRNGIREPVLTSRKPI